MRPDAAVRVRIEATVALSEDPERVLGAIRNVLGEVPHSHEVTINTAIVESSDPRSLDRLQSQLRDRQVRAAARKRFLAGTKGDTATVMVNRQAAAAGIVVLCDNEGESPLGPIYVTVQSRRLDAVIGWLTAYPEG